MWFETTVSGLHQALLTINKLLLLEEHKKDNNLFMKINRKPSNTLWWLQVEVTDIVFDALFLKQ